jgi:hypothetical protein
VGSAQPVSRFAPPEAWATVHAEPHAPRGSQHLRLLNVQVYDRKVNLARAQHSVTRRVLPNATRIVVDSPNWARRRLGLPALGVFLFTPAENVLRQGVGAGCDWLMCGSLAHERVDRCLRVLPGEPTVLGCPNELCDRFPKSRRRATRAESSGQGVRESLLADAHKVGRSRNVT